MPCPRLGVLAILDACSADRIPLWRSQIPLLQLAARRPTVELLFSRWRECRRRYPELYEDVTDEELLIFLRSCGLIAINGSRVSLTQDGGDFLDFLLARFP